MLYRQPATDCNKALFNGDKSRGWKMLSFAGGSPDMVVLGYS